MPSGASPLLFGENTVLAPNTLNADWFLANPGTRQGLKNIGIHIIRMPVRGPSSSTAGIANLPELTAALQDTASLGMSPLVILRNPEDPALAQDDTAVVNLVKSIFTDPSQTIYYEWANENDLTGPTVQVYTQAWNTLIPQLKQLDPRAKFIGPVSYQWDSTWMQYFLANANPLPDFVSWHEYTGSATATESYDLQHIDNWTLHFTAARALMQSVLGKQIPIWITEWNYCPNLGGNTYYQDPTFMYNWTAKALSTLAADGIVGGMHYNVMNSSNAGTALVGTNGSPTPAGKALADEYKALIG